MEQEKKYQIALTKKELDEIIRSLNQLDGIFDEIAGEGLDICNVADIQKCVDLAGLSDMLFKQTHDENGRWL